MAPFVKVLIELPIPPVAYRAFDTAGQKIKHISRSLLAFVEFVSYMHIMRDMTFWIIKLLLPQCAVCRKKFIRGLNGLLQQCHKGGVFVIQPEGICAMVVCTGDGNCRHAGKGFNQSIEPWRHERKDMGRKFPF